MCMPGHTQRVDLPIPTSVSSLLLECKDKETYPNGDWRVVGVSKVCAFLPCSTTDVLAVCEETSSCESNVLVDRLYSSIRTLDEEFRVEKSLDTEDDTVGTYEAHGDTDYQYELTSCHHERHSGRSSKYMALVREQEQDVPGGLYCFVGIFNLESSAELSSLQ